MWLCGDRPLKELGLDLVEWIKKRQGSLKEVDCGLIQLHNKENIQGRSSRRDIKTQNRSTTSKLGIPN
jgi:hypothetical protein